jgi:hypothetical protein
MFSPIISSTWLFTASGNIHQCRCRQVSQMSLSVNLLSLVSCTCFRPCYFVRHKSHKKNWLVIELVPPRSDTYSNCEVCFERFVQRVWNYSERYECFEFVVCWWNLVFGSLVIQACEIDWYSYMHFKFVILTEFQEIYLTKQTNKFILK